MWCWISCALRGCTEGLREDLRKRLRQLPVGADRQHELRNDLTKFVAGQARLLKRVSDFPPASEVIESCFGKFKTVERDQAKGGFTGLLLGTGRDASPSELKRSSTKLSRKSKPETSSRGSRPSSAPPSDQNAAWRISLLMHRTRIRTNRKAKQNWRELHCCRQLDFHQPRRNPSSRGSMSRKSLIKEAMADGVESG